MALVHLHFFSKVLGKHVAAEVLLPDEGKPPFPVFYLLHGLSDDHTIWLRRTRLESYVAGLPMIVVMPDGFRGFYTDNEQGPAFGRYIGEELVAVIDRFFPTRASRSGRAIGGLSMGGYGALRNALTYPETFGSANSHSGAVYAGTHRWDRGHDRLDAREFMRVFGPRPEGSRHDLLQLVRKVPRRKLPKLLIDCGTEDFLIQDNRALHAKLKAHRIPHVYAEFPGSHNWDYWDTHVRDALRFHAQYFGIA